MKKNNCVQTFWKTLFLTAICLLFSSIIGSAQLTYYSYPSSVPQSNNYQVRVKYQGNWLTLFTHYSEPNLAMGPDGNGVTGNIIGRSMSFVQFSFTEEMDVEVTKNFGTTAKRVEIQPKAYNIQPNFFDGRVCRFKIKPRTSEPVYVNVNFESTDNQISNGSGGFDVRNGMMIFADKSETNAPQLGSTGVVQYSTTANISNADIVYFAPGDYNLKDRFTDGVLRLSKNNQKVYIAGGAFVRGAIHGNNKDFCWIYGRGIITGENMVWHEIRNTSGVKDAFLNFMGSDDCRFEGFTILNPTHHTLPSSKRNTYKNIKLIGWASNQDGLRPSEGSLVEEVFIKTHDDYDYSRDPHEFRNSVIWPMQNGSFGQLGWNDLGTGFAKYTNIYFINAEWRDINKRNTGIMGSVLNQGIALTNNSMENIYAENNTLNLVSFIMEYDATVPFDANKPGEVKDFTFKNIVFEKPFISPNGVANKNIIRGFQHQGKTAMWRNINFTNLVLGNTIVTQSNYQNYFTIDPATTSNITFTTEGVLPTVATTTNTGGITVPSGTVPTPAGMTRVINIVPNNGFKIKNVIVDGLSRCRVQTVVFEQINANHIISVEFEAGNDYYTPLSDCSTIPVELFQFDAKPKDKTVVLTWATASEKDNDFFEVERSADGKNFEFIGKVKGLGTTTRRNNYEWWDKMPISGVNYYRLRQVDFNGKTDYSRVVTVQMGHQNQVLKVFPTLFENNISVAWSDAEDHIQIITVQDILGKTVFQKSFNYTEGGDLTTLNLSKLSQGTYFITVKSSKKEVIEKIQKM
jgi:hypothetical protein